MRNVITLVVGTLALFSCIAEVTPERRAQIMARRKARLEAAGGLVTKPHSGNYARIVTISKVVDLSFVKEVVQQFNSGLNIWIEVSEAEPGKTPFETARGIMKIPQTGVALVILEDDDLPTILSAMEEGWSILNVKKLRDDMPPKKVYDLRVRKEINRAFAQAFGVGLSMNGPCVMEPAYRMMDLDAIKFPCISPEAMGKIVAACRKRSIPSIEINTYKQAVLEGWAPAPTNDVQKTLLQELTKVPAKPIEIKFDPKRDAGK